MGRDQGAPVHLGMLEPHLHASITGEEETEIERKRKREKERREREKRARKARVQEEKENEARGTTFQLEPE